jgi:hypothetical protein
MEVAPLLLSSDPIVHLLFSEELVVQGRGLHGPDRENVIILRAGQYLDRKLE